MKYAVVGSRNFTDVSLVRRILSQILNPSDTVVSGGARGVDTIAEKFAEDFGCETIIFLPEWGKYGKSAGFKRNTLIINASDSVIAFWDGISRGTLHSIMLAENAGKPVTIYGLDGNEITRGIK